ncbi:AMED_5909 family protein [Lentzea terrae]|uniref:AMED_5909 family protein n=1 Tax=Lentzea terrae TaxID=2200761 RepID=UPI000DD3FBEE|nr:AMED_5909 family protein [Lentzea terrae]
MTVAEQKVTWAQIAQIQSLSEAHDLLPRMMPRKNDDPAALRRFHEKSAAVYQRVAEIDRGHHHEALYWAEREARLARELGES